MFVLYTTSWIRNTEKTVQEGLLSFLQPSGQTYLTNTPRTMCTHTRLFIEPWLTVSPSTPIPHTCTSASWINKERSHKLGVHQILFCKCTSLACSEHLFIYSSRWFTFLKKETVQSSDLEQNVTARSNNTQHLHLEHVYCRVDHYFLHNRFLSHSIIRGRRWRDDDLYGHLGVTL